jgi:hypothetical protein
MAGGTGGVVTVMATDAAALAPRPSATVTVAM